MVSDPLRLSHTLTFGDPYRNMKQARGASPRLHSSKWGIRLEYTPGFYLDGTMYLMPIRLQRLASSTARACDGILPVWTQYWVFIWGWGVTYIR